MDHFAPPTGNLSPDGSKALAEPEQPAPVAEIDAACASDAPIIEETTTPPWVMQLCGSVDAGFTEVQRALERHQSLDRFKEEQIARLHDELQSYKTDHLERVKLPLINGLIRLHDDLGKVVAALRNRPPQELTPERFFSELAGFADDLELLLGQHGVEPFRVPEDTFDPQRQMALRIETTDDTAHVGRIAERLRPGFQKEDKVLQKERVAVYAAATKESQP